MPNPYGITEIDVPGALNALEAARSNRIRQMLLQRQIAQQERELEAQRGVRAAIQRYTGGGDAGAASSASPSASPAPTPSMGDAVSMYGGGAPATPTAAPALPAATPPVAPPAGQGDISRLTTELLAIDPEHAPQIIGAFRQMDEAQFQAAQRRNQVLARAAYSLLAIPDPAARSAEFQRIAPDLIQNGGVTRQQLAGFELTEQNLHHVINQARDVEKLAEEARPSYRTVEGEVIDEHALARGEDPVRFRSEYISTPQGLARRPGAGTVAPENLPQVATPEEARRLAPGTRFRLPDGRIGTVPGGPTPSASGNFP